MHADRARRWRVHGPNRELNVALESALWSRVKTGGTELRLRKHKVHLERIENGVGVGRPDVNGCIDGDTFDIELKSELRPKRATTFIRPKVRQSQAVWMHERASAGCRTVWVLIQVGEYSGARLYLIPGTKYEDIIAPESDLELMSVIDPKTPMADVLLRACRGF